MKNYIKILVIYFFIQSVQAYPQVQSLLGYPQETNWFGKSTINTIVLIQKKDKGNYINHGVGILFSLSNYERSIVVTCEHLLKGKEIYIVIDADSGFIKEMENQGQTQQKIRKSIWEIDNYQLRLKVKLIKDSTFVTHPDTLLDIGAFPIDLFSSIVLNNGSELRYTETTFVSKKNFGDIKKTRLGEDVYFVGFPFGIGINYILEPLVRSGTIAWISRSSTEFLLDAFSYGGNSGSPVFTKMNPLNNNRLKPYLIGMIVGHLGFEYENFGLARCVYIEDMLTVIELAKRLN